ncbi:MAG: hypothetical protein QOI80_2781 [Solirubrobacteraceae bacterium]|jgi:hypothetical protein|nr:hypothetical protein [Solirubrobacteraceae bacterium]
MSPRTIAQLIAAGRVVIGAALLVSPSLVTRRWIGEAESERPGARVMAMGLGGRDLVVGAGVLAALSQGGDAAKPWLLGSAVADLGDLVGTLRASGELPTAGVAGTALVAGGAAAAGAWLLTQDL